jgi:hypothetical protein
MSDEEQLARALRLNAAGCHGLGSPFSGGLLDLAAADLEAGGPTCAVLAPWLGMDTRSLIQGAVPLRLLGGLHDLVLSGDAPALAACYPAAGRSGDVTAAWPEALAAIEANAERLGRFMDHEPQTNEVSRAACLLGGFLTIAAETRLDLRCFELGASAGLNQYWDRHRYELGDAGAWGAPDAPVILSPEWRGAAPPLNASVRVIERAACDRRPVDLTDAVARRRLQAFVWADQVDRLQRLAAAIAVARDAGVVVEADDAVSWTRRRVAPRPGAATVLYHSVFWQYMPPESQTALAEAIGEIGNHASARAPFAWLRMEPPPDSLAAMELRLTTWPGGGERVLAETHPHGAWVAWGADGAQG